MSVTPVGSTQGGTYEGGRGGQTPLLPIGTLLSAQIVAKLDNNMLRLMTTFGPMTVRPAGEMAAQIPTTGVLHLAVSGHPPGGGLQLSVLPDGDAKPGTGPYPILREVMVAPGRAIPAQQTPPQPQAPQAPQTPTMTVGTQVPATVANGVGGLQLVTPNAVFRPQVAIPFAPETRLVMVLQPDMQTVRLIPLQAQANLPSGQPNPYQALSNQGQPALQMARAIDIPLAKLPILPPAQPSAGQNLGVVMDEAAKALQQSQMSAAPLFQNLSQVMSSPAAQVQNSPLMALATQLLGFRLDPKGGLSGDQLKQAVKNSGLFRENGLANLPSGMRVLPQDMKTLLMRLETLLRAAGQEPRAGGILPPAGSPDRPLPPQRGMMFEAPMSQMRAVMGQPGQVSAAQLMADVQGALARLQLLQLASLPDAAERVQAELAGREIVRREVQLEIPMALQERTTVLQLHIEQEGQRKKEGEEDSQHWRLNFSLQLGPQGAVNAQVNMRGGRFGILLWAEDAELREEMRNNMHRLRKMLGEMGVDISELDCRKFALPRRKGTGTGQMMDATS